MKTKILVLSALFVCVLITYAFAKNFTADARAQNPSGEWVPLKVNASGELLVS